LGSGFHSKKLCIIVSHCPIIDTAEKLFWERNRMVCEVYTVPLLILQKKKGFWRENGMACEVHTTPSSIPQKKYVSGEKTGRHVRCTSPCYQFPRKNVFPERKWDSV
jgi:hypothetical protein